MNTFIGNPIEAIKEFANSDKHRSISEMTNEECRLILDIATDSDDWKAPAVSDVEIKFAPSNFVEGICYLGSKSRGAYNFMIRDDGTVQIFKLKRDNNDKIIEINNVEISDFSSIVLAMMKMNFDVISHLQKTF